MQCSHFHGGGAAGNLCKARKLSLNPVLVVGMDHLKAVPSHLFIDTVPGDADTGRTLVNYAAAGIKESDRI